MQVHAYISSCVCHILKKTLLITCHQIIFSGRDIWKIYAQSSSSGQQHWCVHRYCPEQTGYLQVILFFCIFTVFLAQFHLPPPEKGIYSTPAIKSYRDPASWMERFSGAGQCPVHPWQRRGAVMDVEIGLSHELSAHAGQQEMLPEGTTFHERELENNLPQN